MTNKIYFITSNQGKIKSLKQLLENYKITVEVEGRNLDIMEPQFDTVKEVSHFKALKAFEIIQQPVFVEDGGFCVEALNDFPGVYTKYALKTIGVDGILGLLAGEKNRKARFVSCSTYVNASGEVFQFEQEGEEFEIAPEKVDVQSPFAWSEVWKIAYFKEYGKTLCELTKEELDDFYQKAAARGSVQKFARWYAQSIF